MVRTAALATIERDSLREIVYEPEPRRRQNAFSPSPPRGAAWKEKESKAASMRAPAGLGLDGFFFPCYSGELCEN